MNNAFGQAAADNLFDSIKHFDKYKITPGNWISQELITNKDRHSRDPYRILLWAEKLLEVHSQQNDREVQKDLLEEGLFFLNMAFDNLHNDKKPAIFLNTTINIVKRTIDDPKIKEEWLTKLLAKACHDYPYDQKFQTELTELNSQRAGKGLPPLDLRGDDTHASPQSGPGS